MNNCEGGELYLQFLGLGQQVISYYDGPSCCDTKIQFKIITDLVRLITLFTKKCHRTTIHVIVVRWTDLLQKYNLCCLGQQAAPSYCDECHRTAMRHQNYVFASTRKLQIFVLAFQRMVTDLIPILVAQVMVRRLKVAHFLHYLLFLCIFFNS